MAESMCTLSYIPRFLGFRLPVLDLHWAQVDLTRLCVCCSAATTPSMWIIMHHRLPGARLAVRAATAATGPGRLVVMWFLLARGRRWDGCERTRVIVPPGWRRICLHEVWLWRHIHLLFTSPYIWLDRTCFVRGFASEFVGCSKARDSTQVLVYSGLPLTLIDLECKDCPIITCKLLSRVSDPWTRQGFRAKTLSHRQGPIRQSKLHAGGLGEPCLFLHVP
jgi:hypothetical protein